MTETVPTTGAAGSMHLFPSETRALIRAAIPNPWWRAGLYIGVWLLIGTMSGIVWHLSYTEGNPYTLPEIIWAKSDLWLIWGVFTVVILWLGYHFRVESPHRFRNSLILFGGSLVVVLLYLYLYGVHVSLFLGQAPGRAFGFARYEWAVKSYFTYWFLVYWTIIAIEHVSGYYRRFIDREIQKSQLQQQLVEAQLESLKAQLHPHFLFNSLNTVAAMIEDDQPGKARETVNRLAELLRLSLEASRSQKVTLEKEFAFAERYLQLIRERFADILTFSIEIEPSVQTARVPGLVLQPLVENAIKHGIAVSDTACRVAVRARQRQDQLEICVSNTRSEQKSEFATEGTGVGLTNLRTRLAQLYGDEASVELQTDIDGETRAVVQLPLSLATSTDQVSHG